MTTLRMARDAVAELDPAAFEAAVELLTPWTVARWLEERPQAGLPATLVTRLLDAGDDEIDRALLTRPLDDDALDRLASTTSPVTARAVAGRDDLSADQLRQLLTRDDPETSQTVWDHPSCTDQLRRLILSGTTMNPRARTPHRLIEVPVVDVPARLADAAATSADPTAVERWLTHHASADCDLRDGLLRVVDTVWWHHKRGVHSPYGWKTLARALRSAASTVTTATSDAELAELGRAIYDVVHTGRVAADWGAVAAVRTGLCRLDLAADDPDPDAAVWGRLHRQQAVAADVDGLTRLAGSPDDLPESSQRLLASRRPDLVPDGWWQQQMAAASRSLPAPPAALLERLAADGTRIPHQAVRSDWADRLPVRLLLTTVVPASAVLAGDLSEDLAAAAGRAAAVRLGSDRRRWRLLATLAKDFDGTVVELLDTVDRLAADGT